MSIYRVRQGLDFWRVTPICHYVYICLCLCLCLRVWDCPSFAAHSHSHSHSQSHSKSQRQALSKEPSLSEFFLCHPASSLPEFSCRPAEEADWLIAQFFDNVPHFSVCWNFSLPLHGLFFFFFLQPSSLTRNVGSSPHEFPMPHHLQSLIANPCTSANRIFLQAVSWCPVLFAQLQIPANRAARMDAQWQRRFWHEMSSSSRLGGRSVKLVLSTICSLSACFL